MAERNGAGKGPLSPEDRLAILMQMRDDSLCWAAECAAEKSGKGSAAATLLYTFARDEIKDDALTDATTAAADIAAFPGFDPSIIVGNGMGDRIEA